MPSQTIQNISNLLLLIGTSTGMTSFFVNADILLIPLLKVIGIFSFMIHIILNRRKLIKELRTLFNNCPVDE